MYQPRLFKDQDRARRERLVRADPFATVITQPEGGPPTADHLPLLLEAERGAEGVLVGHVARANPIWRNLQTGREVLAVFHGPHAFVSSRWYGQPEQHVPTWNYAVVHARALPRLVDDAPGKLRLLRAAVAAFQPEGHPLALDPPAPLVEELLGAIVGIELEVVAWEAKLKLSQNREPEDRLRVEAALRERGSPDDLAVAGLMASLRIA